MGREYVVRTWVKHDKNDPNVIPDYLLDESAGYSGEQVGNRLARSHGNTKIRSSVPGWYADGTADLGAFADQNEVSKANPLFKIDPAFRVLAEYQDKILELDNALHAGDLPQSLYDQAVKVLNAKHQKAQDKIDKLAGENEIDQDELINLPTIQAFANGVREYVPTEAEKEKALKLYFNG